MDKIVYAVYRQLYKKAFVVERDVAMRSALTCSPQRIYDHRRGEWLEVDATKRAQLHESRVFVDNLIRRLNDGREFYIPPVKSNAGHHSSSGISNVNNSGAGCSDLLSPSLVQILRHSFESTSFTLSQVSNAFAALKELSYVTAMADKESATIVEPPETITCMPTPRLIVVDEVKKVQHLSLTRGLADISERISGDVVGLNRTSEDDVSAKVKDASKEPYEREEDGAVAQLQEDTDNSCGERPQKNIFEAPKHAQLLMAHPQLQDFFRHTVMLVVRATESESAALVLNKPLENDEGMLMPVNATIRLRNVHPIFAKHLCNHIVMVGGPVGRGSFDSSLLLLHRIPDVEEAVPLSKSIWVDGNYDALQEKIENGTADVKDIMVVCGFSGWGVQQLEGEMRAGTWVAARASTEDPALDDFIFTLARYAGRRSSMGLDSSEGREATESVYSSFTEESRQRRTASWVWAYRTLGSPFADMARNQGLSVREPHEN
ncbi:putative ACR [Trypanosoma vivax]|uniref:YqgE/AlgH family protein n=1 Tax=Trypanosoma vivax (strain Y486) TaxID=1055687 RepID=G0UAW9_TRYVY|nr:hypothetical protein TRVL_00981 [Trypanosoma vivax]KAH8611537.1 putative ACR [Trypanosoma vivax]CCC52956.1 conserved hypothetical protein [Trypanosoma vivax Y486]